MKYLLIQVIDRDITTQMFDYLNSAQTKMVNSYERYSRHCSDCSLNVLDAWVTDSADNHSDCDWKIVKVGN